MDPSTATPAAAYRRICLIGAGPRGTSTLERLCANARGGAAADRIVVLVVDPYPPGAGGVWRTAQPGCLLMNTVAAQVSAFTDASVDCAGPVVAGPTLYEWAHDGAPRPAPVRAEAAALGPDDYPSRALYGHYLEWVFRRLVETAPARLRVETYRSTAVALDTCPDGRQRVTLLDGRRLTDLDEVVLALGHGTGPAPGDRAKGGVVRVPPMNPADADLTWVRPGMAVALRGLGLCFFDYLALLTVGRGGVFTPGPDGPVYQPSGREPVLYAGSRRGVPYHARGANQKGVAGRHRARFLTDAVIAGLRRDAAAGRPPRFGERIWPLIDSEVRTVYYHALVRARHGSPAAAAFLGATADRTPDAVPGLLERYGIGPAERWDWARITTPYAEADLADAERYRDWLLGYLRADVRAARLGTVDGPVKAALDVLRDLRNEVRRAVDHGGISGGSYRDELERWYTPLNAFTSIGPPVERVEQLVALVEAGVVRPVGPGIRLRAGERPGTLLVDSATVPGPSVAVRGLIEARLPAAGLRDTTNPVLRHLDATGQCLRYRLPDPGGSDYETGGLAVTTRPYRVLDAAGRAHPHRFAFGVPTEAVHWVTAAGIRPGVGSVILADADAIARAALAAPTPPAAPDRDPATTPRTDGVTMHSDGGERAGTDSGLLAPTWAGTPAEAAVTDEAWVRGMLAAEAALVRAQARLGLAPASAAATITAAAAHARLDVTALARASRAAANPVVALVPAFTAVVAERDPAAAEYVHRGSTSQDILDSATMLIARRVLDGIAADLARTAAALARLAEGYRGTLAAGRTLAQHAVPTTFGLRAAGWLGLTVDALVRTRALAAALPAQLGGAAGTLSAYQEYARLDRPGAAAVDLIAVFAEELGLAEPVLPWHTARTPVAELGAVLSLVTGALGKFAVDVRTLSRPEIGEVSEPTAEGRGASSAMPQKRNPVLATLVVAAARQLPGYASILASCLLAEDERPAGEWHAEWQPLREALRLAGGAAHAAAELAEGLVVHPDRMAANLELGGGTIMAERITVALAPLLGRARAKKVLTAAAIEAADTGRSLAAVLATEPTVTGAAPDLDELLDPAGYTGAGNALIDRALRHHRSVCGI